MYFLTLVTSIAKLNKHSRDKLKYESIQVQIWCIKTIQPQEHIVVDVYRICLCAS